MWSHVIVEAFCLGNSEDDKYPCGALYPTSFCLGDGKEGGCPYFAWTESNEREAAVFVSLTAIIWDKVLMLFDSLKFTVMWYLWDKWTFNKDEFMENITVADCPDCDKAQKDMEKKFKKWFK